MLASIVYSNSFSKFINHSAFTTYHYKMWLISCKLYESLERVINFSHIALAVKYFLNLK